MRIDGSGDPSYEPTQRRPTFYGEKFASCLNRRVRVEE